MYSIVLSLTLFRILAAPFVFIAAIFLENYWLAFWLFNLAALTDYFDGYLARKYSQESDFGKVFDPIADKILICFSLISISLYLSNPFIGLLTSIVLAREIIVSGLREFASHSDSKGLLDVTFFAKTKTSIQFVTIISYLVGFYLNNSFLIFVSHWILFLATLVTIKSGYDYYLKLFSQ